MWKICSPFFVLKVWREKSLSSQSYSDEAVVFQIYSLFSTKFLLCGTITPPMTQPRNSVCGKIKRQFWKIPAWLVELKPLRSISLGLHNDSKVVESGIILSSAKHSNAFLLRARTFDSVTYLFHWSPTWDWSLHGQFDEEEWLQQPKTVRCIQYVAVWVLY